MSGLQAILAFGIFFDFFAGDGSEINGVSCAHVPFLIASGTDAGRVGFCGWCLI